MKTKIIGIVVLTCFCFVILSNVGIAAGAKNDKQGIKWYSYKDGMALSKKEKKKVFMNFYADWCRYCKVMSANTFVDRAIIAYLNANYVAIKVNSDIERDVAKKYEVRALPSTWFIAVDGEPIANQPGYIPADTLLPILKFIQTDSYLNMKFSEFKEQNS
ncbi:thioredoxin family protein [Desulfobacterales bacterium HSG16]|nr:thioredoxin family protein [Desulfobacterales bacterium HSG16]